LPMNDQFVDGHYVDDDLVLNDEQPMRVAYSAIGKRHIRKRAAYIAKYPQKQAQAVSSLRPYSAAGRAREYPVAFANASGGGVYRTLGEAGN